MSIFLKDVFATAFGMSRTGAFSVAEATPADRLVGLLPAAGSARRISPLPCSKEILPVGYVDDIGDRRGGSRAAIHFVLEQIRAAGGRRALIVLSPHKMDLPAYLTDGAEVSLDLAYLVTREPWGVPFTLDRAYPYVKQETVLFGFPDILIDQPGVFEALLQRLNKEGDDVVLGLFPANTPAQEDLVALDAAGKVRHLEIKVDHSDLTLAWMLAVWRPTFSRYLHEWVDQRRGQMPRTGLPVVEPYLGDVINDAISAGLKVGAVAFYRGSYLDIGSPANLVRAPDFVARLVSRVY
jgi:glucose-1-phosphate thymidylyltransferase